MCNSAVDLVCVARLTRGLTITLSPDQLRVELRRAGIANAAVDAVWPQWWSDDAASSLSATAELTFTVARRLGLAPRALLDGEARFVWRDETKFKHLKTTASDQDAALSSFGTAVARALLAGVPHVGEHRYSAMQLREAILGSGSLVNINELLVVAWGFGVPVIQMRLAPLSQKRMHAMTAAIHGRCAILLAREASYLAPVTFTVAHELGHLMLGHLDHGESIVDIENPLESAELGDDEEVAADQYALELLTGTPSPAIVTTLETFSATELAAAVRHQGPQLGIDPGVLAMCVGHSTKAWAKAYGALKIIPPGERNVSADINQLAESQIRWHQITDDSQDYLRIVMGISAAGV